MILDSITEEIRAGRHRLAEACGNDLERIFAAQVRREADLSLRLVTIPAAAESKLGAPEVVAGREE